MADRAVTAEGKSMGLFLKNLLYTLLVPATFAVYLPWLIAEQHSPVSAWTVVAAVPFFAVGAAIYLWCVWDFAHIGRATPAPVDAPKRLVTRGLYQYVRNPLYVGVFAFIIGWTILWLSIRLSIYFALAGIGFHLFVVVYEERHLQRKFGPEYEAYRDQVGRWIPKPFRSKSQ